MKAPIILLVDDDQVLCRGLIRAFEEEGLDFVTAQNGVEALKALDKLEVDLIVTDIMMPEMDGMEFLDTLESSNISIPVIAISGGTVKYNLAPGEFLSHAKYMGAKKVFEKPFCTEELMDSIKGFLFKDC